MKGMQCAKALWLRSEEAQSMDELLAASGGVLRNGGNAQTGAPGGRTPREAACTPDLAALREKLGLKGASRR